MQVRYNYEVALIVRFVLTGLAGWVVGKLESNAKLNSKVKVEVEVGVELGNKNAWHSIEALSI